MTPGKRSWSELLGIGPLVSVLVALLGAAALLHLDLSKAEETRQQFALTRIQYSVARLQLVTEQAVGAPRPPDRDALYEMLVTSGQTVDQTRADLATADLDTATTNTLTAYLDAVEDAMVTAERGDRPTGARLFRDTVSPIYADLLTSLAARVDTERGRVQQSNDTQAVAVFIRVLTTIFLSLAFAAFAQRRRDRAETRHREELEERFRSLIEHSPDAVGILSADGRVLYHNGAAERLLGERPEERSGGIFHWLHPDDVGRTRETFERLVAPSGTEAEFEARMQGANGEWRIIAFSARNLLEHPAVGGVMVTYRDVTQRTVGESQLRDLAYRDPVTGMGSRALLLERLRAARDAGLTALAVISVDLDDLRSRGESHGRGLGDAAVAAAARRLTRLVRPGDDVARVGDDEFALLVSGLDGPRGVARVADRLMDAFSSPISVGDHDVTVRPSVGAVLLNDRTGEEREPSGALQDAEFAMSQARHASGGYRLYDGALRARAAQRAELAVALRRALIDEQLVVEYRPIVELGSGHVVALEALVAWRHPDRGVVPAAELRTAAEDAALVERLEAWTLRVALRDLVTWREALAESAAIAVHVGVSLRGNHAANDVEELHVGSAHLVTGDGVVMEVRADDVASDTEAVVTRMRSLREQGMGVTLIEFGSGAMSLADLPRLPISGLTLASALSRRIDAPGPQRAILATCVELGEQLGLTVTATGVAEVEQLDALRQAGVTRAQGSLFAEPVGSAAVPRLVVRSRRVPKWWRFKVAAA